MKHTIFKTMVALLLTLATTACTDDMPVDGNTQGDVVLRPEGDRITSLKNILPSNKPGYQGVDGRAYNNNSEEWSNGDELLLKVVIKNGENTGYTAWMTLQYNGTNWSIKSTTEGTGDDATTTYAYFAQKESGDIQSYAVLPLVTPTTDIVLTGDGANFEAIIPEEIVSPVLNVELMYAPDLEWSETTEGEGDAATTTGIALSLKENPSTPTPEVWKVTGGTEATDENVWDTSLARVCVETGTAGDVVTLTSNDFTTSDYAKHNGTAGNYTTTTGTDGIAYFYGTIGTTTPVTTDFKISLDKVKLSEGESAEPTDVFIPTTLFEANALTEVSLKPAVSYKLDGTSTRTQAADDSKSADTSTSGTYKVSGVKGLLQWAAALNFSDGKVELSLKLEEDITLPQYEIQSSDEGESLSYSYLDTPISYDASGNPTNSNWIKINSGVNGGFTGTIDGKKSDGKNAIISGLRLSDTSGIALIDAVEENAKVENLTFIDAKVTGKTANAAVIVKENRGTVNHCFVKYSEVNGAGDVGAIVATNKGTVSDCHNVSTDVIAGYANSPSNSELVGGIVGHNVGVGLKADDTQEKSQATVTGCTNSGKVISHGVSGHNFTGGIVGHSYGFVMNCKNTGSVESSTDCTGNTGAAGSGYYTSVAGIVGNCSFGRIIACINEGNVKSGTKIVESKSTYNRVGGIVGYSGTNSYVVACGNIGTVTTETANNNHLGGIVGQSADSYGDVDGHHAGKVYGSWTKEVDEKTMSNGDSKDGIGSLPNLQVGLVNETRVFKDKSVITETDKTGMNDAISNYNGISDNSPSCNYTWKWTSGSWPEIEGQVTNP